jgi:hypothetical protein
MPRNRAPYDLKNEAGEANRRGISRRQEMYGSAFSSVPVGGSETASHTEVLRSTRSIEPEPLAEVVSCNLGNLSQLSRGNRVL